MTTSAAQFKGGDASAAEPATFQRGLKGCARRHAAYAHLRDLSGIEDLRLIPLLQQLRDEALRPAASLLFVRGIGHAIAVHLARNYIALSEDAHSETSALPGFKCAGLPIGWRSTYQRVQPDAGHHRKRRRLFQPEPLCPTLPKGYWPFPTDYRRQRLGNLSDGARLPFKPQAR